MRHQLAACVAAALLFACGPDKRECSGPPHPAFHVELELANRSLAPDTVVEVTYGGTGTDQYRLAMPDADHKVIFCTAGARGCSQPDSAAGAAGAAGAGNEATSVDALCCDLWTSGFTHLKVEATGQETTEYDLYLREHVCTVNQVIVLDSPDGG